MGSGSTKKISPDEYANVEHEQGDRKIHDSLLSDKIYPAAIRQLPGNSNTDGISYLPKSGNLITIQVYRRVQSLFFYTVSVLVFSIFSILTLAANHRGFQSGSLPASLQPVGYAVAVLPIIAALIMLASDKIEIVKVILIIQQIVYLGMVIETFVLIINDFALFFYPIGMVCVLHVCFLLWSRQVKKDVDNFGTVN